MMAGTDFATCVVLPQSLVFGVDAHTLKGGMVAVGVVGELSDNVGSVVVVKSGCAR